MRPLLRLVTDIEPLIDNFQLYIVAAMPCPLSFYTSYRTAC